MLKNNAVIKVKLTIQRITVKKALENPERTLKNQDYMSSGFNFVIFQ